MKRIGFLLLLYSLIFVSAAKTYANGVVVNGESINAVVINKGGRLLVPARNFFEALGATVEWLENERKVAVKFGDETVEMAIGSKTVSILKDGTNRQLESNLPPEIINGSVYVPLGVFSESIGWDVHWSATEKTAYISFNNANIIPADIKALNMVLKGKVVKFDDSATHLTNLLGEHDDSSMSVYNYDWQTYAADINNFALIGVSDEKTVAFYSNSSAVSIAGIKPGMSTAQLNTSIGAQLPDEEISKLASEHGVLTVYRNSLDNYSVLAVLAQKNGFADVNLDIAENISLEALENRLLVIINSERANRGLAPFNKENTLSEIARGHSRYMVLSGELSHDSNGISPFDKLEAKGITDYIMASENIGRVNTDDIEMFANWMNSKINQSNLISKNYNHIGIGAATGGKEYKMYFTADFIEK